MRFRTKRQSPASAALFHLRCKFAKRLAADVCGSAFDGVSLTRGSSGVTAFGKILQGLNLAWGVFKKRFKDNLRQVIVSLQTRQHASRVKYNRLAFNHFEMMPAGWGSLKFPGRWWATIFLGYCATPLSTLAWT